MEKYRKANAEKKREYDKQYHKKPKECEKCGFEVFNLNRHHKTNKCKYWELMISRIDMTDPELIGFGELDFRPIPLYKDNNKTIEYKQKYFSSDPYGKPS